MRVDLQTQHYLAAGLGALVLGAGTLAHTPGRMRNRLFALFCAALALWNLAKVCELSGVKPTWPWPAVYLLGACAAAPLGVHFVVRVAGSSGQRFRGALPWLYAAAAILWISALTPAYHHQPAWNIAAMTVMGGMTAIGVLAIGRHMKSLPEGLHRNAARLVAFGAAIAAVGGLSDLLPRGPGDFFKFGPASILVFLLIVCGILLRHRFLDVHSFLAEALAVIVGAVLASAFLYGTQRLGGNGLFPLLVATLVLITIWGPLWRILLSGMRSLLGSGDPVAAALMNVSGRLPSAQEPADLWRTIDDGLRRLPGSLHVCIRVRRTPADPFQTIYRSADYPQTGDGEPDYASLSVLLEAELVPVTRYYLELEATETSGSRRSRAVAALQDLRRLAAELAVPLQRGETIAGWIAIGGEHLRQYPSAEVAAAFLAVGNQALACLDRIEAQSEARRRAALAAVGEMAAGLAHEVRNPLGAIRGAAQVLSAGTGPTQTEEMLGIIEAETGRLGRVVGDFLDYARPASPRRDAVDLADLARRVLRAAEVAGMDMRAEVVLKSSPARARGDPDQLQRAFANLVRNAREAAGPEGRLRVEVGRDSDGRCAVRFEDNGPGIPPEVMARLFEPFLTTKPGGTGLGLALVHRVVQAHGGEVRVEGRPGLGAAITIVLPADMEAA